MNAHVEGRNLLNRLDTLSPWAFTGTVYLLRWLVVLPISFAIQQLSAAKGTLGFEGSPVSLLFGFLILAPVSETLLECTLPYWLMAKVGAIAADKRPWGFVAVSAILMALLHLGAWPAALVPSLVTGSFLAYTYSHFARNSTATAILHTCVFHASINLVGWILLFLH